MTLALDTSAYAAMRRGDPRLRDLIGSADRVLVSTIVLGELWYGFAHGKRPAENRAALRAFLTHPLVDTLPVTPTTADRYARIAAALRRKGSPIPTNDMWIAAQALEAGADLVSFDRHFGRIEGLAWVDPQG